MSSSPSTKPIRQVSAPAPVSPPEPAAAGVTRLWNAVGIGHHLAVMLTLGTIVLLTYANSFNTKFALDNKFIILEDPRLRVFDFSTDKQSEITQQNLKLILTQDYWWPKAVSGLYRPVTTLSYWFNYAVLGGTDSAAGYHWVNLLLHWANAILVYFVILVLMGNSWPALFVAALFATHPVVTESVTNLIGRADMFAGLAVLGGFLLYAKSALTQGWARVWRLVLLAVVAALGFFAKESAVVLVGVIVLYDFTYRIQPLKSSWPANLAVNFWQFFLKGYVALLPALLAFFYVRSRIFGNLRPPELPWVDNPLLKPDADFWTARFTAIKVVGKYLWLLVWPGTLSPDYSFNQIPLVDWRFNRFEDWKALLALGAVVWLLLVAVRNYKRNKPLFFFILFFFIALLPTANLLPRPGEPLFRKESWVIGSIMAERFLYVPLVGFAGCLVIAVYMVCRRLVVRLEVSAWAMPIWLQVFARSVLGLIVVAYGARSFARNFDWEDDVTLWTAAVRACPNSFKTHKSLAYAMYEADPKFENIDQIIEEGEKALAITHETQIVLLHLGAYYRIKGDQLAQKAPDGTLIPTPQSRDWYNKSVAVLRQAVPLDQAFNEDNRQKELRRGRPPENVVDIGNHEIYWNLGMSLTRLGQYDKALEAYDYMRHLAPTNPDAYLSMASAYLARGELEPAAITLLQTLLLDNSRQETLRTLVELYRQIDREGCAVIFTAGEPKLNVDCKLVANHMCHAYLGLVQIFMKARQYDLAQQTRQNALTQYHCLTQPFDAAMVRPLAQLPAAP